MGLLIRGELDFVDQYFYNRYFSKIEELFDFISFHLKKGFPKKDFFDNVKFCNISYESFNIEHIDYLLFKEKFSYEVFQEIDYQDFFDLENITLEKILSGEIKICFFDDFNKIAILNKIFSFPEKIENILVN
ncbi:hypothetical protein DLH72_03785 [Candidatus Gracilibacteria bacterium]|nr:MAG: hypothetical protein DLH72_03785 [Candidatus Gracilibacteria bacterium]